MKRVCFYDYSSSVLSFSSEDITAIVFSAKNAVGITSYGLISTDGEVIQNTYYTAIYYMVNNGETTYFFNKLDRFSHPIELYFVGIKQYPSVLYSPYKLFFTTGISGRRTK